MNFDHYANVDEDEECLKIIQSKRYYNPNSNHWLSKETHECLTESYKLCHSLFPMYKSVEFIPGGGTGANMRAILENTFIRNIAIPETNDVIMISSIEHSSVFKKVAHELNIKGYTIVVFPVDKNGFVNIQKFKELLKEYLARVVVISCILTNNEIGTIQPINELVKISKELKPEVIFHSDCACNLVQLFNCDCFPDIVTFSCYKFHGPHIGMLLSNVKMNEAKFGTPDVKNFYFASLSLQKYISSYNSIKNLQLNFKLKLKTLLYENMINNNIKFIDLDTDNSAHNILAFIVIGIKTSLIQKELSNKFIAIGSGSACTTNEGSHTVLAMGYSEHVSSQLVRLSFNYVDKSIISEFIEKFIEVVIMLKFINKNTNIEQKIPTYKIIRPSLRKLDNVENLNKYDLKVLEPPKYNCIQISSAEQSLKGMNKQKFCDILTQNIKLLMKKKFNECKYKLKAFDNYHMIYVDNIDNDLCDKLAKLPGVSVVHIYEVVEDENKLSEVMIKHFNNLYNKNQNIKFAVRVKITGKTLCKKTNKDWEYYLGKTIQENFNVEVNLDNPDITVYIKGYNNKLFVGTQRFNGIGGLPSGSEGNTIFFVDKLNFEDSCKSVIKMYTRGTIPVIFTNNNDTFSKLEIFLEENCIKYYLKLITNESINTELELYDKTMQIVYETSRSNIYEMKKFGKKNKRYVCSLEMFSNPDIKSESFFMNNSSELNQEKGLLLISGGFDSPVASHILHTNNFKHDFINFIGSIDDKISYNKIISLVNTLNKDSVVYFVEFGKLQEEIAKKCSESYRVMMYKIYMILISNLICKTSNYGFIAMGNSLGQVASQTPQNLYVTDHFSEVPILSPLVGINKTSIIDYARHISNTEEISRCNGNDCCVQFLPKNPILNASICEIEKMLSQIENYESFIKIYKI